MMRRVHCPWLLLLLVVHPAVEHWCFAGPDRQQLEEREWTRLQQQWA